MPLPTIFELYDFESQIEVAAQSILTAGFATISPPLNPQIIVSRDSDTETTPRIELQFATGHASGQMTTIGQANPKQVPAAYAGILTARIVTSRPDEAGKIDPLHPILRGATRYFFSAGARLFTPTNLPWLQILELLPATTQPQLQENLTQDIDVLTWAAKFAIINGVWPAT